MTNEELIKYNNLYNELLIIINNVEKHLPLPATNHTLGYINDLVYNYIINYEERTREKLNCPFCNHKLDWDIEINIDGCSAFIKVHCFNCYKI